MAATVLAGCALSAAPAFADETDAPSDFTVTGNVQGVTDYRFRGLSQSGGDFAIQGSIGVSHSSGFYVGTWASSIEDSDVYGSTELDLYAGWTGAVTSGLTADVGMLYYAYPNGHFGDAEFFEPYASVTAAFGPATVKVGGNYAWDQDALGGDDNLYLYGELGAAIPDSPVSIGAHLGWTDGALSPKYLTTAGDIDPDNGSGFDYSLTGTIAMTKNLSASLSYVGVDGRVIDGYSDDTAVASLKLSF
jgi:uncharacterized protein (TIGR02001 family)